MSETNNNPTPERHHFISPSHLERYEKCPGALRLTYGIPDVKSPAGLEGTIYHGRIAASILNLIEGKTDDETDPIVTRSVETFRKLAIDNPDIHWTNGRKVFIEHEMPVPMADDVFAAFKNMMLELGAPEDEISFSRGREIFARIDAAAILIDF